MSFSEGSTGGFHSLHVPMIEARLEHLKEATLINLNMFVIVCFF